MDPGSISVHCAKEGSVQAVGIVNPADPDERPIGRGALLRLQLEPRHGDQAVAEGTLQNCRQLAHVAIARHEGA